MASINNDFWLSNTNSTFSTFFNNKNSNKNHWGVRLDGRPASFVIGKEGDDRLTKIFTNKNIKIVTGYNDINIYQFLIMTAIMINETNALFKTDISEFGNFKYMFSAIPNVKTSYNCSGVRPCSSLGNKSAYDLFHDSVFMNLPARTNMYKPKDINDDAWKGYIYPSGEPTGDAKTPSQIYKEGGLIAEADFYKFRGRGVIQLTGRSNYKLWFKFIIDNKSTLNMSSDSLAIVNGWGNNDLDTIATKITNTQLDTLFSDISLAILLFKTHSSNKILVQMYNVQTPNEFIDLAFKYGKSISGSGEYGNLFANRVFEILEGIEGWITPLNSSQTI